ncbi:MAG TPA: hypothetical protein VL974_01770 [Magnetospirillum sp.]|nr:hypothetical protein [Magnetospirillum sp.]
MTLPRFLPLALSALLALSLSACAGLRGNDTALPPHTAAPSQQAGSQNATPPKPATKPGADLKSLRPMPRPDAEAKDIPQAGLVTPKLVGLSEDETIGLLGRPAEETLDPPGKTWVYRALGCRLSVHLFPDMEKGGFYALDYSSDSAREPCLGKVAGEARKKGSAVTEDGGKAG